MGLCLPPSLAEETFQGFKYSRLLGPLCDHLHLVATERDRAGNRHLFYDQYATLLLVYFLGTHLRRDTIIPPWFQASKAAAASDRHAVHF